MVKALQHSDLVTTLCTVLYCRVVSSAVLAPRVGRFMNDSPPEFYVFCLS